MTGYTIETRGTVRELYWVEADSPEEARAMFENGEVTETYQSEVADAEIVSVTAGDD